MNEIAGHPPLQSGQESWLLERPGVLVHRTWVPHFDFGMKRGYETILSLSSNSLSICRPFSTAMDRLEFLSRQCLDGATLEFLFNCVLSAYMSLFHIPKQPWSLLGGGILLGSPCIGI